MGCGPPNYLPLPSRCAGSPPDPGDPCCGDELSAFPSLTITIPDGVNIGTYTLTYDVIDGAWEGTTGSLDFVLSCVDGVMNLTNKTDSLNVNASAFVCDPLLFTFPGAIFGSTGNVVVEL